MNKTLLALVIGLAAGVCGALVPGLFRGEPAVGRAGAADPSIDWSAVLERLDRIEERLALSRPILRGSAGGAEGSTTMLTRLTAKDTAVLDAIVARYDERMREVVGETVAEKLGELSTPGLIAEAVMEPEKKKVTLAEFAKELELSSYEEDELRRLHEQTIEKALDLLSSEEDGGVETVRQDLARAKEDPANATAVVGKYLGRLIGNIGGFVMLGQEHDRKVKKLIGEEKAKRLDRDYELTDVDPYDLETVLEMGFGD